MSPGRSRRSTSRGRRSPPRRRSPRRSRSRSRRRSPPRYSDRRSRSPRRRSRSRSRNRRLSPRRSPPGRKGSPRRSPRRSPPPKSLGKRGPSPARHDAPEKKGPPSSPPRRDARVSTAKAETVRKEPSMPSESQVASSGKSAPAMKKSSDRKIHSPPRRKSFSPRRRSRSPARRRSRTPPRYRSRSPPPRRRSASPRKRRSRSRSPPGKKGKSDRHDDIPLRPEHRQPKHIVEEEEKLLYGDVDERGAAHGRSSGTHDRDDRQLSDRWPDRDERVGGEWVKPKSDTDDRQIITHFIPDDEYQLPHNPGYFLPKIQQTVYINERWSDPREKSFVFSENISIGIERNIRGNSPVRRKPFQPSDVTIPRREDEGNIPLYKREEFEKQGFVERRVIKVMRSENEERAAALSRYEAEFQKQTNIRSKGNVDPDSWQRRSRSRSRDRGYDRSYSWRSPDRSRARSRDRDDRYRDRKERSLSRDQRVVLNRSSLRDGDTRFSLMVGPRGDEERTVTERNRYDRGDLRRTIRNRSPDGGGGRSVRDPKDLRFNLLKRTRPSFDARMRISKPRDEHLGKKELLPDFSRRPDKFKDNSWINDPSSIPKGGAYFEHDNRDGERMFRGGFRGRGRPPRGGFRGRGFFRGSVRGSFRGRPSFSSRRGDEGRWEHDKFQDLEDDKDKEPSSTTK